MFVKGVKPDDNAKGVKPDGTGVQGFRLPPTFSLLWTLGPNQLRMLYFFFSFPSFQEHSKNTAGNGGVFFIFQKRKIVPSGYFPQIDPPVLNRATYIHRASRFPYRV